MYPKGRTWVQMRLISVIYYYFPAHYILKTQEYSQIKFSVVNLNGDTANWSQLLLFFVRLLIFASFSLECAPPPPPTPPLIIYSGLFCFSNVIPTWACQLPIVTLTMD